MAHSPLWQNLIALALVLGAAAYLARRWWPALSSLLGRDAQAGKAGGAACGQGGGCKQCGSSGAAPQKDHRIVIVRRRK